MHHDGKIGMYSTPYLGGGGALYRTPSPPLSSDWRRQRSLTHSELEHELHSISLFVKSGQMSGMGNAVKTKALREDRQSCQISQAETG